MRATLSILGLWTSNPQIFSGLNVPAGVNKTHVIDTILLECAELECLYPDAEFMRQAIGIWSSVNARDWSKLMEAAAAQFNPVHNYDRYEEWTDDGTGSRTVSGSSTESIAGFNSSDLAPASGSSGSSTDGNSAHSQHSGHLYGNIGVTTAPQMLKEFIEIEPQLNIYRYIAESFKNEFCLMIY